MVQADREGVRDLVVREERVRDLERGQGLADRVREVLGACCRDLEQVRRHPVLRADRSSVVADSATKRPRKAR